MPGAPVKTPHREVHVLWTRGDMRTAAKSHSGAFFHWLTRLWAKGGLPQPVAKTGQDSYLWTAEDAATILELWHAHRALMDAKAARVEQEKREGKGRYREPARARTARPSPAPEAPKSLSQLRAEEAEERARHEAAALAAANREEDEARAARALEWLLAG